MNFPLLMPRPFSLSWDLPDWQRDPVSAAVQGPANKNLISLSGWDGRIPKEDVVKPMIALRAKADHTRRRRPWTRAFSSASLKGYEDLVTKRSVQLVETIGLQKGVVDITKWVSFFAYVLVPYSASKS